MQPLASCARSLGGPGIVENAAQHGNGIHQRLAVRGLQSGKLRLDHGSAVGPEPVERAHTFGGDPDADCPGIAGVDGPGDQAGIFEPSHLRGHRRLRAVVHGGQITDPGFNAGIDGRQQSGLRGRQLHMDALGGIAVEPGDYSKQVRAQTGAGLLGRATIGGCG